METFRAESERLLADIRDALVRRDADALTRPAHALKGALATLAAGAAAEAARRLEAIARLGDMQPADEAYATLERELRRLEPELAAVAHADRSANVG